MYKIYDPEKSINPENRILHKIGLFLQVVEKCFFLIKINARLRGRKIISVVIEIMLIFFEIEVCFFRFVHRIFYKNT